MGEGGDVTSTQFQLQAGLSLATGAVLGCIAFIFGVFTDRKLKVPAELREQFGDVPLR